MTCCHSVVASKWPKTRSVCSAGRNILQLKHKQRLFRVLQLTSEEVRRAMHSPLQLKQVFSPCDYVNIMDHSIGKIDGKKL